MDLFLVRHADSHLPDVNPDPPISGKGIHDTKAVATWLKNSNIKIDGIWVSVKKRAGETAGIIAGIAAPHTVPLQKEGLKPSDNPRPIFDEIQNYKGNLMIVSHLPFLEKLLSLLLLQREDPPLVDFQSSSVLCLKKEESNWKIYWLLTPEFIK